MPAHYSDRCLKVLALAAVEAQSLNRPSIGTEHILLAILDEGTSSALAMLHRAGVTSYMARSILTRLVPPEMKRFGIESPPWCPTVQEVIDMAEVIAQSRGHFFVGNQHLLLALLQKHETVAWRMLGDMGVDRQALYEELLGLLSAEAHPAGEIASH